MFPTGFCKIPKFLEMFPQIFRSSASLALEMTIFAPPAQKTLIISTISRLRRENLKCFLLTFSIFLRLRRKMFLLWNSSFHSYQVCSEVKFCVFAFASCSGILKIASISICKTFSDSCIFLS